MTSDDIEIKVQFVQWRHGWEAIPITSGSVRLRYSDLTDTAELRVQTPSSFAAMKLTKQPRRSVTRTSRRPPRK